MLSLMLDPRFKNLRLVSFLIGQEEGASIVRIYDMRSFFLMFLKCHLHLHPIIGFEIVEQNIDVDNNLDIFEMTTSYSELMKGLVNMELLSFRHYHVDIKKTKCLSQWWET